MAEEQKQDKRAMLAIDPDIHRAFKVLCVEYDTPLATATDVVIAQYIDDVRQGRVNWLFKSNEEA